MGVDGGEEGDGELSFSDEPSDSEGDEEEEATRFPPFSLHPTPYTLHPTPYTLHPTP